MENLMMVTPALVDDPVGLAILHDPILMERLADFATAKKYCECTFSIDIYLCFLNR